MWLFAGRYASLGPTICLIALVTASIAILFAVVAVRLVRRSDLDASVGVSLAVAASAIVSGVLGFGEQVVIPPNSLNRGIALFLAVGGVLVGVAGMMVPNRIRFVRVLILLIAAGVLL